MIESNRWKRAAETLQVEVASIRAFAEVESSGDGWLDARPKIRFEDHLWRRYSAKTLLNLPPRKKWGDGYHVNEWRRFNYAHSIDPEAAILCTSWRAFQIMGFNYKRVGFKSVAEFFAAMMSRDFDDLDAFVLFVKSDVGLWKALQRRDWREVARRYNGKGNEHVYAPRIEEAYERMKGAE